MKNQELFREALADAKTLQNVALANAKKSLEEAFGPKIESMFKSKLAEMEKEEMDENAEPTNEVEKMEEELEGILQELGMDNQEPVSENEDLEESEIEEADEKPAPKKSEPKSDDSDDESDDLDMGGEDMESESEDVTDLTVDELTSIIQNAVQTAMGGGETDMGMDDMGADDMGGDMSLDAGMDADMGGEDLGGEEELDLDELIAELDGDINENEDLDENQDLEEAEEVNESEDLEEGEDLDEAAKKAFFEKGRAKGGKVGKPFAQGKPGFQKAPTGKTKKMSEATDAQLQEAIKTIKALKSTLVETNLLNAKLLFVNKLFKAKQLTESQKVKVVAAFDKARTKNEAETIYQSLNETLGSKKKTLVRESLGFASKPTGSPSTRQTIVEDATVQRFKKLAGII